MPPETMQTLQRAFALLDCFTPNQPELGVREAARLMNLSTSSAGRLLTTMKELGILSQNPETHVYSLGSRVLSWAGHYSGSLDVRNKALTYLPELHRTSGETVSLYVADEAERVCVERIESTQNLRLITRVGDRTPIYAGAAGKVLLAFLPYATRLRIYVTAPLIPLTDSTLINPDSLEAELETIRASGYAVSHGERIPGASAVAAPVFGRTGEIIAALAISGPAPRFTPQKESEHIQSVLGMARKLSQEMGYSEKNSP